MLYVFYNSKKLFTLNNHIILSLSFTDLDLTTFVKLYFENENPFPLLFLGAMGIPGDNPQ